MGGVTDLIGLEVITATTATPVPAATATTPVAATTPAAAAAAAAAAAGAKSTAATAATEPTAAPPSRLEPNAGPDDIIRASIWSERINQRGIKTVEKDTDQRMVGEGEGEGVQAGSVLGI